MELVVEGCYRSWSEGSGGVDMFRSVVSWKVFRLYPWISVRGLWRSRSVCDIRVELVLSVGYRGGGSVLRNWGSIVCHVTVMFAIFLLGKTSFSAAGIHGYS